MFHSNDRGMLPELIPLHQVPDLIPSSRRGKRLALATLYRWSMRKKLATIKVGGGRYVTRDAMLALTHGESTAAPPARTASERARCAGEELDRLIKGGKRHGRSRGRLTHRSPDDASARQSSSADSVDSPEA